MAKKFIYLTVFLLLTIVSPLASLETLFLANNLQNAKNGDYIITKRDKNFVALYIKDVTLDRIQVDEITIPENKVSRTKLSWRDWLQNKSPNHTSWVTYYIELPEGKINEMYSQSQKCYLKVDGEKNLFTTLMNLEFQEVPFAQRKRRGPSHITTPQNVWQPKMIKNGQQIPGVSFTPYTTKWPSDGSVYAGTPIVIYIPEDSTSYPAYFPYWMQSSGAGGKVQLFIVDSGRDLSYLQ